MIKLSALNDESDEESGSEERVSREAPEQIALQQYAKALDLQRKGNLADATQLLKDLLDTELLYNVQKPAPGEKAPGPLYNMKYLCYKNLAAMLSSAGEVDNAIEAFYAASELDDTDVTLWHRLGLLCMQAKRYEMALEAFQRGIQRNPRHWPCIDKSIILLLALDLRKECITSIYDALQLDPGYLRGLVYRRHIYTNYKFERDYLEYINPIYRWNENDEQIDEEKAEKLLKESEVIKNIVLEQQKAEQFSYIVPHLKLKNPITVPTWKAVGEALVDMHHYMTEKCFSHACPLQMELSIVTPEENMEVDKEEIKEPEVVESNAEGNFTDTDKNTDITSETENNEMSDRDKPVTDTEKAEGDTESAPEPKLHRKNPIRRRGSSLRNLQLWEWCNTKRSTHKKKQHTKEENIYDILRKMVPTGLVPEKKQRKENQERETSPIITSLESFFEEKSIENMEPNYFGTKEEEKDVQLFINKYIEKKHDIIDILKDYLNILAQKWRIKWENDLVKVFIKANECYNTHIDKPACTDNNKMELIHYASINLVAEELIVNNKLNLTPYEKESHDSSVIDYIGIILSLMPHIFIGTDCLDFTLRHLWVKLHIHILNKNKSEGFELDSLHGLLYEFEALGDHKNTYNVNVVNFTYKPDINMNQVIEFIKSAERNIKLEIVKDLFSKERYEEVAVIISDTFEHFKTLAKQQEDNVALDFAVYLTIILDTYWALGKVDLCLQWAFTCLHEALKHYFHHTSGSAEYEKWTLTVVKILCSMEYILNVEGLSCLDVVPPKDLSEGLEDLIRIIGHQIETNATEMPFDSVAPWIIMHYILQREEDQGRGRPATEQDTCDEIPFPLMLLFIAHEQLGEKNWCCKYDGKLLYFTLDTVVPRLHTPALSKSLEMVSQFMEQCVYCLFGHPSRSNSKRGKYLADHKATPRPLDWFRAQQVYDIFRPSELPELEGNITAITLDTENLFSQILDLLPPDYDPNKYIPEMENYINGIEDKLPVVPPLLPCKMKDIYFFMGDYNFKKPDIELAIKFNTLDVIINNDRFLSWAQLSLAKAKKLEHLLNSCKNFKNDEDFLNPAKSVIRCFKRSLLLDPTRDIVWTEYGSFVYSVHSFCSRLLKQASESLSMENFEYLEKQKEDMLDITQKCFNMVLEHINSRHDGHKSKEDNIWQAYYMLGKVAEKRNKPPSVYLAYYNQGIRSLQEHEATYPTKINYGSPTNLCLEVLELHYRIHASILKYIEQHENKPIPASVGKVFSTCIEEWLRGPFTRKKRQEGNIEIEGQTNRSNQEKDKSEEPVQAANILKRSASDAGEEDTHEVKKLKLESAAAKFRRSYSYENERSVIKEVPSTNVSLPDDNAVVEQVFKSTDNENGVEMSDTTVVSKVHEKNEGLEKEISEQNESNVQEKKEDSSSSTSSSSSSDSSSSESTSDSSSDSSRESDSSSKSSNEAKALTDDEIMKISSACLDALEDCASRFPQHYKALYRLAHYYFYCKRGKDIERSRDFMLSTFTSKFGRKLAGLFSEKKSSNFFNNIWKLPNSEVDRGGSFPFHLNRSVLLTMEILKEFDDHSTLLELSLHLQKIPEPGKQYLRDSDREELAQQAILLCVQSLKGQLIKFSQQADLKTNEVEKQAMHSLLHEIHEAYRQFQRQPIGKQLTNLIVDGYKLLHNGPFENKNLVDLSMKYCQWIKAQGTKKPTLKVKDTPKSTQLTVASTQSLSKADPKPQVTTSSSASSVLPKLSAQDMAAAFQNYVPLIHDSLLSQQAAAALSLSYLSNISASMALQSSLQSSLQYSLQNSFQAEFYRQCVGQSFSPFSVPPPKKQKRGPKSSTASRIATVSSVLTKPSKSTTSQATSVIKAIPTSVITSQKSSASLAPSMGTVLPTLPASMTVNLTAYGGNSSHSHSSTQSAVPAQAHMASSTTVNTAMHSKPPMPHQQVSPGKTLQEKLAERQKNIPSVSKECVSREISQSISRLPSSLTITKTAVPKQPIIAGKRSEAKKSLPFSEPDARSKPIASDEIIVLDDD